jgi:hypothetical protein
MEISKVIFLTFAGVLCLAGYYFGLRVMWKIGEFGGVGWSIEKSKQPILFRIYFAMSAGLGILGAYLLLRLVLMLF